MPKKTVTNPTLIDKSAVIREFSALLPLLRFRIFKYSAENSANKSALKPKNKYGDFEIFIKSSKSINANG